MVSVSKDTLAAPTFVSRVTSIPVVVEAYSAVNNAVNTLAEKNKYAKYAVDTTNSAVHTVVNKASQYAGPYQERFAPQISKVDEMGTKMLDIVENKFPIINQPSAQVISNARGAVSSVKSSVVTSKPVTSASNVVKNLEAALASVMDNVEVMVEKYLPEQENAEAANGAASPVTTGQVSRAVHISIDVQRRLTSKLVAQIKHLQESIPDASTELLKLKESSHLINAATESIRSLNEKLAPVLDNLKENATNLKDSSVERAKSLDAQFEISERIEPLIRTYLNEITALTEYVQAHIPGMKAADKATEQATEAVEAAKTEGVRVLRIVETEAEKAEKKAEKKADEVVEN